MNAILLAFAMWFSPPHPGELVLMADGDVIAVIADFKKLQIGVWGMDPNNEMEILCECSMPTWKERQKMSMERKR